MRYRVFLQQYVEQTAVLEIDADSIEEAKDEALALAPMAEWGPGDDAHDVDVYLIKDASGAEVWERS